MRQNVFSRRYRPLWAATALIVVIGLLFTLAPVRTLAGNLLALFRVQQITFIEANPANLSDPEALEAAIAESLSREVPHPNAVRLTLQRRREQRDRPPPIGIRIDDQRAQKLVVRTHDLNGYDQLQSPQDNNPEQVEEGDDDDTQK